MQSIDDLSNPFGNPNEACLHQALYHIENGAFDQSKQTFVRLPHNDIEIRSLRDEIGAY